MTPVNSYKVYCLSYNNLERKNNMEMRFKQVAPLIDYYIYDGVNNNDERLSKIKYKRVWSCMYRHLDMIKMFYYDKTIDYGIFCEDDILIHKDFGKLIPTIIDDFKYLNLDVLLLGYLIYFTPSDTYSFYQSKINHKYYNYADNLWGTQMYILSKENAKNIRKI